MQRLNRRDLLTVAALLPAAGVLTAVPLVGKQGGNTEADDCSEATQTIQVGSALVTVDGPKVRVMSDGVIVEVEPCH